MTNAMDPACTYKQLEKELPSRACKTLKGSKREQQGLEKLAPSPTQKYGKQVACTSIQSQAW